MNGCIVAGQICLGCRRGSLPPKVAYLFEVQQNVGTNEGLNVEDGISCTFWNAGQCEKIVGGDEGLTFLGTGMKGKFQSK